MLANMRNHEKTYSACPVLSDNSVQAYLRSGELPADTRHIGVPATKIIRNRGFWLNPSYRCHTEATVFLVSTDVYAMNADDLAAVRSQIFCYYSESAKTHYIGRIQSADTDAVDSATTKTLAPLIPDLHSPIPLSDLLYVGRIIAAS